MVRSRVMIIDELPVICMGLSHIINQQPDMIPVGSCYQTNQAIESCYSMGPDIVIIDVSPIKQKSNGVIKSLKEMTSAPRVVAISTCDKPDYIKEVLHTGADGYVLKTSNPDKIVEAIRLISNGNIFLDPDLLTSVIGNALNDSTKLSLREHQCLHLLAEGYGMKEAARIMSVSIKTIDTYKRRSFEKLGFRSRVDLVKYATCNGWLDTAPE